MRPILVATFLSALGIGCGDRGPLTPLPDRVYITPQFVEAFNEDYCCPQIGERQGSPSDWEIDGASRDDEGVWAEAGDSVVLRVQSPLYRTEELSFIVPDTVTGDPDSERRFSPIVRLSRLVPALLRAEWTADFTGPTVRVELLAPSGLAGVRITGVSVHLVACYDDVPGYEPGWIAPCTWLFAAGSPWQPDSTMVGLQGWADLSGPWTSWPADLPPVGYTGADSSRAWSGSLIVNLEDGNGRTGYGSCNGASVPSTSQELQCTTLF